MTEIDLILLYIAGALIGLLLLIMKHNRGGLPHSEWLEEIMIVGIMFWPITLIFVPCMYALYLIIEFSAWCNTIEITNLRKEK